MTKRKRSLSSDTSSPAVIYSTRSSAQKSLILDTTVAKERLIRDSSTPTTERTNQSLDFQNSPSSSRTSSNIIEAITTSISSSNAPRPSKPKTANKLHVEDGTISPVASKASTNETPDRPGRRRKPTQKAAELAANSSSKLFKTGGTGQTTDDDAISAEQNYQPGIEHIPPESDQQESSPASASRESSRKAPAEADVEQISNDESTVKQEDDHSSQPITTSGSLGKHIDRPRRRKQKRVPQQLEEAPVETRSMRLNDTTPAVEINVIPPASPQPSEPTKSSTTPVISSENITKAQSLPSEDNATSESPKKPTPTRKRPSRTPQNTTTYLEPPNPITETSPTQVSQPSPQKPTRIKFKPLQTTITSALAGYTRLPCDLSCLPESDLFYIWAKLAVEREDMVEELCTLEQDFDGEGVKGGKDRVVRGKLNAFLLGFCVCEKSTGGREREGKSERRKGQEKGK